MAGASVKMGVDVTQFKQGMREAQTAVKTLDAELKKNEAQFKATGDKETYMAQKSKLLKAELEQQKTAAKNAEQALKAMANSGVSKTSEAYQKMAQQLAGAQAAMYSTEAALNSLSTSESKAATGAKNLTESVNSIGKKISLDQVISGINKITGGLEKAAQKAVEAGKAIWDNIMDSAQYSDDVATQAMILDMSVEKYQQYKGVFDTIGELSVRDWMTAKRKVEKAIVDPSNDQIDVLRALGFVREVGGKYGNTEVNELAGDWEQAFWDAAKALRSKVENGEISQEMADVYGEALFGKKFSSLKPLMALGQEGFEAALKKQIVASEEAIQKNAALNDALINLQDAYKSLEAEVTSGLAPALQGAAESLSNLLGKIMEYLKTPKGQEMLNKLGEAVSGLFDDLGKIDPEQVVSGFVDVFTKLTNGIEWLVEHKDDVVTALEVIAGGFATLKVGEGVLTFLKLIQGFSGLFGAGTAAETVGTGLTTAGSAGLTGVASIAAEWSAFSAGGFGGLGIAALPIAAVALTAWAQSEVEKGWTETEEKAKLIAAAAANLGEGAIGDANMLTRIAHASNPLSNRTDGYIREAEELKILNEANREALIADVLQYGTKNGFGEITTSSGYYLVDELNRYWENEPLEQQRIEAITDALQQMYQNKLLTQLTSGQFMSGLMTGMNGPLSGSIIPEEIEPEPIEIDIDEGYIAMQAAQARMIIEGYLANIKADVQLQMGNVRNGGTAGGGGNVFTKHANGLFSVPWDGYPAILHKGERVMTAREVTSSRNYSSNLYVESMYMNNGMDADGLAAAMAAAQRRTMNGYGS